MDAIDFQALEDCISSGDFDTCEAVPAGESTGFLIQPLGGLAIDMAGAARCAMGSLIIDTRALQYVANARTLMLIDGLNATAVCLMLEFSGPNAGYQR